MIYLTQNTTNTIVCEANTLNTTGFYLWRFVSEQYKTEELLYIAPTETNDRFVKFSLTLPGDVDLSKVGKYHYYVYDGDGVSTDYDTMTLLENGQTTLSA